MPRRSSEGAGVAAAKQFVVSSVMLLIQLAIHFFSAGYVGVRPWIFYGASFVHYAVSIARANPRQQQTLFENTARAMGDSPKEIKIRHIRNCLKADPTYGKGVADALGISLGEAT